MAYATHELFDDSSDDINPSKRVAPTSLRPVTFAAVGTAPTYAKGTPVAFDTAVGKWKVWTSGGANGTGTIGGFIWPDDATMDAADDTLVVVMLKGEIHYKDVVLPDGEDQGDLETDLKSGPRLLGLDIKGLAGVH